MKMFLAFMTALIPLWSMAQTDYPQTKPDALPFSTICQGGAVDFTATVIDDGRRNGRYLVGLYKGGPDGVRIAENVGTYTGTVTTRAAGVHSATNKIRVQFTMPRPLTAGSGYVFQLYCMDYGLAYPTSSTQFTIKPLTTLTISGNPTITAGTPAPINFTFTGTPPFTIDYNDYSDQYANSFLRTETFSSASVTVTPRMNIYSPQVTYNDFFVRNLRDNSGCPGPNTVDGGATVTATPLELVAFLDRSSVCAGGSIQVQYAPSNNAVQLKSDFIPLVQLSDASGNFSSPITLGTGTQGNKTTTVTIPGSLAAGTGYRIRIISPRSDYNNLISPRSVAVTITKADRPT